ncbi:DUF2141 domain-containing protein [Colwellia sp. E2M01]|uniref:DUF2141 domain-containing protein n=1 Tax=Colwellia sp. E2M01 TaxID=2841561 RepID=UPI001C0A0D3B|nr:DUF2141 domain-containing protein [Colwellia sp. E2M01]MBU2871632.1 DUF2141 domain-containing protein [Colwellia sp. E2M01]
MIKLTTIISIVCVAICSNLAFSSELTVNIKKVEVLDKVIMMELFLLAEAESTDWMQAQLIDKKRILLGTENQQGIAEFTFSNIENGRYALRVFQDLNDNGFLDRSSSDIPVEPIGFSNNPSLFGGEPTPEDSVINVTQDTIISINLKHKKPRKKRNK